MCLIGRYCFTRTPLIQRRELVGKTPSASVLLGEERFALLYIWDDCVAPRFPASGAHWGREMEMFKTREKDRY